jgi:hypothetical protein
VAKEPASLRPPSIHGASFDLLGYQLSDLVFETFAAIIAEGEIVRVCANPQRTRLRDKRNQQRRQQHTEK